MTGRRAALIIAVYVGIQFIVTLMLGRLFGFFPIEAIAIGLFWIGSAILGWKLDDAVDRHKYER